MAKLSPQRAALRLAETAVELGHAYLLDLEALRGLTARGVHFVAFDFGSHLVLAPRKAIADPLRELSSRHMKLAAFVERAGLVWRFREHGRLRYKCAIVASLDELPPDTVRVPLANPADARAREVAEAGDRAARWQPLLRKIDRADASKRFAFARDGWSIVTDEVFALAMRADLGAAPEGYEPSPKAVGIIAGFLEIFEHGDFGLLDSAELTPHLSLARKAKEEPYLIEFRDGRKRSTFAGRALEIATRGLSLDGARAKIESKRRFLFIEAANGEWRLVVAPMSPEYVSEVEATLDIRKR